MTPDALSAVLQGIEHATFGLPAEIFDYFPEMYVVGPFSSLYPYCAEALRGRSELAILHKRFVRAGSC